MYRKERSLIKILRVPGGWTCYLHTNKTCITCVTALMKFPVYDTLVKFCSIRVIIQKSKAINSWNLIISFQQN